MDPDLIDAVRFTSSLPQDGKVLTLPLTFPSYQIAFGKTTGAFVGMSMISNLAGKSDFPGFWVFGHVWKINIYMPYKRETKSNSSGFFIIKYSVCIHEFRRTDTG